MDNFQIESEEINLIREKILNSNSEYKKMLLDEERVKNITKAIGSMSEQKIRENIFQKIEQIKGGTLSPKELEKIECELAILITYLPIDGEKNRSYWKEKEENARKNRK